MRTLGNVLIILFVVASFFVVKDDAFIFYQKLKNTIENQAAQKLDFHTSLSNQEKEIITPGPLTSTSKLFGKSTILTRNGVIEATNEARMQNGNLPPLKENTLLNNAAKAKLDDMFAKQYFEHDSPDGKGVGDLGTEAGYEFIIIGENLALGDFGNDASLVTAWMNSPGHRKNILTERYQEIGVAVGKGMYEGRETWMAVQHFALPRAACPQIDEKLKVSIQVNQQTLNRLETELENKRKALDTYHGETYQQKVAEYNSEVSAYNALVSKTKNIILEYNTQVSAFNTCAEI